LAPDGVVFVAAINKSNDNTHHYSILS